MKYSPVSFARRHVLGDLYPRCDSIESVPVFLCVEDVREEVGHADEGLGHYADAFCFYLSDEICKKLMTGNYTFSFDYEVIKSKGSSNSSSRIAISSITLNARKAYAKPIPRRGAHDTITEDLPS
jgi:hypothetical protein